MGRSKRFKAKPFCRALLQATALVALWAAAATAARADDPAIQVAQAPDAAANQKGPTAASTSIVPAPKGDAEQLEEVTVTARYRAEDVQDTPIAITALTGDQIEARGITNVIDAANQAPNVEIQPSAGIYGKSAQAFIRGVGQQDFDYALSPAVGFYIDDVYFDSVAGTELDLLDLDHIEVLRGPQGTLFGKNTEGGAVRIFTEKPKGDDSGYLEVGYGSYNRERARGAFDIAVVPDKVFIRVSGGTDSDDGYQKLIDFACANPKLAGSLKPSTTTPGCQVGTLGGTDVQDGRVAIRVLPFDGLEINFEADVLNDHSESPADSELVLNYGNETGTGIGHGVGPTNPYARQQHLRLRLQFPEAALRLRAERVGNPDEPVLQLRLVPRSDHRSLGRSDQHDVPVRLHQYDRLGRHPGRATCPFDLGVSRPSTAIRAIPTTRPPTSRSSAPTS